MEANTVAQPEPETAAPRPPVARRIPKVDIVHGDRRVDDYFWLRDKDNPEVAAYLEAENAYADAVLKPTARFQAALYQEMLARIQETDLSVPYRDGGYFYYSRTEEGKQYPILCRKKGSPRDRTAIAQREGTPGSIPGVPEDAPEEVTLDLNALAEGHPFFSLGAYVVSDDGSLLAYSTDVTGFREYTLHVKDLRTREVLPERIERTGSVAWAGDGRTLFYTVEDAAKRPHRLYRRVVGTGGPRGRAAAPQDERRRIYSGAAEDTLVYEERDELFRVFAGRSHSRALVFLVAASHTTTEVRYLPSGQPEGAWKTVAPREHEHEYDVEHHSDRFFIRTNDQGRNFRLAWAPVADPRRENWKEVVPPRSDVMLEGLEVFRDHYVLQERVQGLPRLRVTSLRNGATHDIAFPEPAYSAFPDHNPEFDTQVFRYTYQSLVTPSSVLDYDMETRKSTLLKEQPVLGGYDRREYHSERLFASAPDGVQVPISVVYREGLKRDGSHPMHLTGYGAYGFPFPVGFSSNRLSLLDRGFVFAIAHVRGGGELGKMWHDDGRMMKKRNTFTDFIAVAEHLMAQGYTSRERLVIEGGSAGGLLMGAVANMRPELFKVIVSKVPFVDVINTMLDASLPLTIGEWEEWGNPHVKEHYEYMKTYCPYTNLEAKAYPVMLVKTSFHDSQVMYWEPAKYVAKLRALNADGNLLVLKTNMEAGHGGASGRYDYLREVAFDYAFMLTRLGIDS